MILAGLPKRGTDDFGSGAFEAPRGVNKDKTPKLHKGIDYACYPDTMIQSTVMGTVTKFGYPYGKHPQYRYVEITDGKKARHRFFYVEPSEYLELGDLVTKDDIIGISQDIAGLYNVEGEEMKNHVHYEILVKGKPVDPELYV